MQVFLLEEALFLAIHRGLDSAVTHWERCSEIQVAVRHRVVVLLSAVWHTTLLEQLYLLLQQREREIGGHVLIIGHNSFLNLNIV